jgi:hypothetical protein
MRSCSPLLLKISDGLPSLSAVPRQRWALLARRRCHLRRWCRSLNGRARNPTNQSLPPAPAERRDQVLQQNPPVSGNPMAPPGLSQSCQFRTSADKALAAKKGILAGHGRCTMPASRTARSPLHGRLASNGRSWSARKHGLTTCVLHWLRP